MNLQEKKKVEWRALSFKSGEYQLWGRRAISFVLLKEKILRSKKSWDEEGKKWARRSPTVHRKRQRRRQWWRGKRRERGEDDDAVVTRTCINSHQTKMNTQFIIWIVNTNRPRPILKEFQFILIQQHTKLTACLLSKELYDTVNNDKGREYRWIPLLHRHSLD